jgi:hypothetical protein
MLLMEYSHGIFGVGLLFTGLAVGILFLLLV